MISNIKKKEMFECLLVQSQTNALYIATGTMVMVELIENGFTVKAVYIFLVIKDSLKRAVLVLRMCNARTLS